MSIELQIAVTYMYNAKFSPFLTLINLLPVLALPLTQNTNAK